MELRSINNIKGCGIRERPHTNCPPHEVAHAKGGEAQMQPRLPFVSQGKVRRGQHACCEKTKERSMRSADALEIGKINRCFLLWQNKKVPMSPLSYNSAGVCALASRRRLSDGLTGPETTIDRNTGSYFSCTPEFTTYVQQQEQSFAMTYENS